MTRHVIGALLLFLMGLAAIAAVYFLKPHFQDEEQRQTSDAREVKGKITIAVDNWIGYFPLCSPEMKKRMRQQGWTLSCEDDQADYPRRMKKLRDGEIDFAVATVDSYLLNGAEKAFPGTIVAVIDESKGGDAIVARQDAVPGLSQLKGRSGIHIAFTPGSPSHHLIKAAAEHFDVPELHPADDRRIETKGSAEALNKLLAGKAQVAALWEPDVSRALSHAGIIKLLGTEDTKRLIVDVLVVNREYSKNRPDLVKMVLSGYFKTLKLYSENRDLLREHVAAATGLAQDVIDTMLGGVEWINLTENCEKWFGISQPGDNAEENLIETIDSTSQILVHSGDFSESPVPSGDPYRLTHSQYVEDLYLHGLAAFTPRHDSGFSSDHANSLETKFGPLEPSAWDGLQEIGALRADPIVFQSATSNLDFQGKLELDNAVDRLKHYPNFRVLVKGHTGLEGDPEENKKLSKDRAEAVCRYLQVTYNIDPNRLRAVGMGGEKPLPRLPGESLRAYRYRLPRVDLVLVKEMF